MIFFQICFSFFPSAYQNHWKALKKHQFDVFQAIRTFETQFQTRKQTVTALCRQEEWCLQQSFLSEFLYFFHIHFTHHYKKKAIRLPLFIGLIGFVK
jgi:hypothetical protein